MAIGRAPQSVTPEVAAGHQEPSPRLFTVDEYYKMAEVGILRPDERVQLIEGVIVQMPPIGPRHAFNVDRLADLIRDNVGDRARVRSQNPVRLASGAEPEPDVAVVRSDPSNPRVYASRHPGVSDILLLIEVADTTVTFDLGVKARMYGRHNVSELWVIDLPGNRVIVHREPTPTGYANVTSITRGETISALEFPDVTFTADEILG
jgi:Uma2 family endonuclease